MPNVKLEKGRKYRVLIDGYKNPFAGLKGVTPVLPVRIIPPNQQPYYPCKKGDVLTYLGSKTGWGSDPGIEEWFETEEGLKGELSPAGIWGGVDERILTPNR